MSKKPAIFISKTSALRAIVAEGKKKGVPSTTIITHGRTKPVYKRGNLEGYIAFVPNAEGIRSPVVEA